MAERTVIYDTGMIKHRSGETSRYVTDAAILVSRQMIVILTGGVYAIVAGRAVIHDARMIEIGNICKTGNTMTNTTILVGRRMIRRLAQRI